VSRGITVLILIGLVKAGVVRLGPETFA